MPNVFSKLPEMPHDGIPEGFSSTDLSLGSLEKPLNPWALAVFREPHNRKLIRDLIFNEAIPLKKGELDGMDKNIKRNEKKLVILQAFWNGIKNTKRKQEGDLELYNIGVKKLVDDIEWVKKERKICFCEATFMTYVYNNKKSKSRNMLHRLKLKYGVDLERQMEDNIALRIGESHRGEAGQEENIRQIAELFQTQCNMFDNFMNILFD
jgi:hypothetical protein